MIDLGYAFLSTQYSMQHAVELVVSTSAPAVLGPEAHVGTYSREHSIV